MRNLHSEWIFLHSNVFQKRFWFFEKNIYRELSPLIFFRSVLIFYWKTNSTNNFLHSKSEKSPFWMEISPFNFLSEVVWTLKKIFTENFIHSIFFRSVLNFFFEKQTPQIIFSIQNGEISILNGDFSIHFVSEVFGTLFDKKTLYRKFYPFRMDKSPFWIEIYPFIFFRNVLKFFEKISTDNFLQNSTNIVLHSEWVIHYEWRFLHLFFSEVFWTVFEKISTENCLHSIEFSKV